MIFFRFNYPNMRKQKPLLLAAAAMIWAVSFILVPQNQQQEPSAELKASMAKGKEIYTAYCLSCHMENGEGIPTAFPPLAKSDYLMKDRARAIRQVIFGVEGEIEVNGETYYGLMPPTGLKDDQVAHVVNYIRNTWGNKDLKLVTVEEVSAVRAKGNNAGN
jgi:mono/diheme cytochrome c family protein